MSSLCGVGMAQQEKKEEEKDEYSLEAKFTAAVQVIRSLPDEGDESSRYVLKTPPKTMAIIK